MSTTTNNTTSRPSYPQAWAAYNAAQVHEKAHVADLLRSLCDTIESPEQRRGRPRIPLGDAVFSAVVKIYGGDSGRRTATDLREYEAKGYLSRAPHYNSVFNALESDELTAILKHFIEESARPLRALEHDFAVDSSGFASRSFSRWFDHKYGRGSHNKEQWIKAHIMVGVKTNVVTSVEVTRGNANDYPWFAGLVRSTAQRFDMREISADKAYIGRSNVAVVGEVGAIPLIPIKPNTTGKGDDLWRRMFQFQKHSPAEFDRHYHKRSNVETTFSMIKAKFGSYVRSKTPTAQMNEVLCKVLCHNLCCLVQAAYEQAVAS
jgi:transposase